MSVRVYRGPGEESAFFREVEDRRLCAATGCWERPKVLVRWYRYAVGDLRCEAHVPEGWFVRETVRL